MSHKNMPLAETFEFSWNQENPEESLVQIIAYARTIAMDAYTWYATEKTRESRFAVWIRVFAIILGGAGGIIPILSVIKTQGGTPLVSPAWSTAAIGCAGILVIFDRFFGFSSGWMRFAKAMLSIRVKITEFDMDIADLKAHAINLSNNLSNEPSENNESPAVIIKRCKKLVIDVNDIILNESDRWKQEFTSEISQMDDKIKKGEKAPPAAVKTEKKQ